MKLSSLPFILLLLCTNDVLSKSRYSKKKEQTKTVTQKHARLNTDGLPGIIEILEKLELSHYLKDFIKMGVTETRLLLRLSSMDYSMMKWDWEGITDEEITKIKQEVESLTIQATAITEEPRPELDERSKLKYGRVYIPNSVQSFEYALASFGAPPPVGKLKLTIAESILACETDRTYDYSGSLLVIQRGNCTFLQKAQNAFKYNASAVLFINNEDLVESPASGYGITKNVTEASVLALKTLPIISMSNNTWAKLERTLFFNDLRNVSTYADIVPLKCHSGGVCVPLLEEEKNLQSEVSWGTIRTTNTKTKEKRSFEFLSSTFGGPLPTQHSLRLTLANPIDACTPLEANNNYNNSIIVVHRGSCAFDIKVLSAQNVGARGVIIIEVNDESLQRIGGMPPTAGYVGIPSVIVTAMAGEYLHSVLDTGDGLVVEFNPSGDSTGADKWIDIAFTQWADEVQDQVMQLEGLVQKYEQTGGGEIVAWLKRRILKLTKPVKHNMDTDEL